MSQPNTPRTVAVEHLETLGLSHYAAKTFVALVGLESGTARDVSDTTDVPRSRVYDAVEELRSYDLVETEHSTPKRFTPVATETAVHQFQQQYNNRLTVLSQSLAEITSSSQPAKQCGVRTITGTAQVTEKFVEFVDAADTDVHYVTSAELHTPEIANALKAATERSVSIQVSCDSASLVDRIRTAVEDAVVSRREQVSTDDTANRLLVVDGETLLVSVQDTGGSNSQQETAIWSHGRTDNLRTVFEALLT